MKAEIRMKCEENLKLRHSVCRVTFANYTPYDGGRLVGLTGSDSELGRCEPGKLYRIIVTDEDNG